MKVKNIMFFGFAAAILSATGAKAEYTPTDADRKIVTSKAYVESRLDTKYDASNPRGYQANVLEGVQVGGVDQTITNKKVNLGTAAGADVSQVDITGPESITTLASDTGVVTATQLAQMGALVADGFDGKQSKDSNAQLNDIAVFNSTGSSHSSGKQFTTSVTSDSTDSQVPTAGAVYSAITTATADVANKQDREAASAKGTIAVFDTDGNSVTSGKEFDGGQIRSDHAYVPTSKAVYDALATKQNLLGGGTDAGKVVTATSDAGVVSYTTVSSTIDTTVNTDNNNIPTVGAVEGAITTATANVANKQDKVTSAGEDNIATWDANGNTKDSSMSFDTTTLSSSATKVPTSEVVTTALSGKQDTLTFDDTPTANSANPVTSGGVYTAVDAKQNKLGGGTDAGKVVTATGTAGSVTYTSIDATVQSGSSNLVTSGAVQTAINGAIADVTYEKDTSCTSGVPCALVDDGTTKKWYGMAI